MQKISVPREWVESIRNLGLPPAFESRRLQLLQQNYEGRISECERDELRTLMKMNEPLAELSAQARNLLKGLTPDATSAKKEAVNGLTVLSSPEEAQHIEPAVVRWYIEEEGL